MRSRFYIGNKTHDPITFSDRLSCFRNLYTSGKARQYRNAPTRAHVCIAIKKRGELVQGPQGHVHFGGAKRAEEGRRTLWRSRQLIKPSRMYAAGGRFGDNNL